MDGDTTTLPHGGDDGGGLIGVSPVTHSTRFHEELDSQAGSTIAATGPQVQRSDSQMSTRSHDNSNAMNNVPKKKTSFTRKASVRRNGSRRSLRPGSVKSLHLGDKEKYAAAGGDFNSAFYVPIPTSVHPTDVLAERFQCSFFFFFFSSIVVLFCLLIRTLIYSLAQGLERLDCLLQGPPKII